MSPFGLPESDGMMADAASEMVSLFKSSDWLPLSFEEGPSMQNGAIFWPRFD
jgi:hypothetical protein